MHIPSKTGRHHRVMRTSQHRGWTGMARRQVVLGVSMDIPDTQMNAEPVSMASMEFGEEVYHQLQVQCHQHQVQHRQHQLFVHLQWKKERQEVAIQEILSMMTLSQNALQKTFLRRCFLRRWRANYPEQKCFLDQTLSKQFARSSTG